MVRICSKCGKEFPATRDFFHYNGRGELGLEARCKLCANEHNRDYYLKNTKKVNDRQNKYRRANPEKHTACNKAWRDKNLEHVKAQQRAYHANNLDKARAYYLKKKYGITQEQYDEMLSSQDFKCAICKRPASKFTKSLHVDHRHGSKPIHIRGLLCANCNHKILGRIRDKRTLWVGLGDYINRALKEDKEWR